MWEEGGGGVPALGCTSLGGGGEPCGTGNLGWAWASEVDDAWSGGFDARRGSSRSGGGGGVGRQAAPPPDCPKAGLSEWGAHPQWGGDAEAWPDTRAPRAHATREVVSQLGLDKPLVERHPDEWRGQLPRADAVLAVQRLREGIAHRLAETTDSDRQRSAVAAFSEFMRDTDRLPFVDPTAVGGKWYNQETLDMFAEYLRERGSRKRGRERGKPTTAGHISSLVSAVRLLVERHQRMLLTSKADNVVAPLMFKHMRKGDGPPQQRRLSRGIRGMHLRKVADLGYQRRSGWGLMRWAVAATAINLLLRGGEVGVTKRGASFDAARDISWSSFDWHEPCAESRGRPWLIVDVVGIKDSNYRNRVTCMPICRRHSWDECALGDDPACAYDALFMLWMERRGRVTAGERAYRGGSVTPFFVSEGGGPWCTRDTQDLAVELGSRLGFAASEVGGKAFRIGGATDLREVHGGGAQLLIKERGRWASDVAQLYQRALLRTQLDASAGAADADGRDMEEALTGWVQPAAYYVVGG